MSLERRRRISCEAGDSAAWAARGAARARSVAGGAIGRRAAMAAFSVLVLTIACGGLPSRGQPVEIRDVAPAFTLPSHDGRTVSLSELLARGPALVVFYRGHW